MKNKVLIIIALMAIIGFAFITCDDGNNNNNNEETPRVIPVKLRAYNNQGIAPAMASINSRATAGIARSVSTTFSEYDTVYSQFNAKISDITPTKFIPAGWISLFANNGEGVHYVLTSDFAQGITIDLGDIPVGITCSLIRIGLVDQLFLGESGTGEWELASDSMVEFPWPADIPEIAGAKFLYHVGGYYNVFNLLDPLPGDIARTGFITLHPFNIIAMSASSTPGFGYAQQITNPGIGRLVEIIYGAGERRIYENEVVPTNSVITGFSGNLVSSTGDTITLGDVQYSSIVIPFTPITIPEDAVSVSIELSWNLNGLIERYEGATTEKNDDIFVLKKGWWDGLYIKASVE